MNRKKAGLLGILAATALLSEGHNEDLYQHTPLTKEEQDQAAKERKQVAEVKRKLAQGLKMFVYDTHTIWARNQKNADRKAKNKGYIK